MKNLFTVLGFFLLPFITAAQVTADPAHQQIGITTTGNIDLDAAMLPLGGVVELKVPILNLNTLNGVPAGSCKIKIGLGSKMELDPDFNLAATSVSAYFDWVAENQGGQVQLTGDLKAPLPPNFSAVCAFRIRGTIQGNSTITTNFLITNHNTAITLSDENPNNNTSFLPYTVIIPVPVTFTGIALQQAGCDVKVNFSAEQEINVDRYEIEVAADGGSFTKTGELPAAGSIHYSFRFTPPAGQARLLHVRVKSVDKDGKVQYTPTRTIRSSCEAGSSISLYPNPLPRNRQLITLRSAGAAFSGSLQLTLLDAAGRQLRTNRITVAATPQLLYETGSLPAGEYFIRLQQGSSAAPVMLRFQQQ